MSVRSYVSQHYCIQVNCSPQTGNYCNAWAYCTKADENYVQSEDLRHIVIKNCLKTKKGLLRFANKQLHEGKTDTTLYILNNTPLAIKIMDACWEMKHAMKVEDRESKSRLQLLQYSQKGECVADGNGQWKLQTKQTLKRNNSCVKEFSLAVMNLLVKGRGKGCNTLIVGPANCAKTFLIKPLCTIFNAFANPAKGTFNWVGVEEVEIIFLNDFRWSECIIPWEDMLHLLEGNKIHVPTPKTHFAQDIVLEKDTPIFFTAPSRIRKMSNDAVKEIESEIMDVMKRK